MWTTLKRKWKMIAIISAMVVLISGTLWLFLGVKPAIKEVPQIPKDQVTELLNIEKNFNNVVIFGEQVKSTVSFAQTGSLAIIIMDGYKVYNYGYVVDDFRTDDNKYTGELAFGKDGFIRAVNDAPIAECINAGANYLSNIIKNSKGETLGIVFKKQG